MLKETAGSVTTGHDDCCLSTSAAAPAPPSTVSVLVGVGSVSVVWSGPGGDCYSKTVVTLTTPHSRYTQTFTDVPDAGHYYQVLAACDAGQLEASVQVVGGDGEADVVTGSHDFSGDGKCVQHIQTNI